MPVSSSSRKGCSSITTSEYVGASLVTKKIGNASFESFMQGTAPAGVPFSFLSLFSGAGVGDYGLRLAGGRCLSGCEIEPHRRAVHKQNFDCPVWGDVREDGDDIIEMHRLHQVDLLVATPPCQGFSSANSRRGKRAHHHASQADSRNDLFVEIIRIAAAVKPKVILIENVPNFLDKVVAGPNDGRLAKIRDLISEGLQDYIEYTQVVCFSRAGVPQRRKRAVCIYVHRAVLRSNKNWESALHIDNWLGALEGTPISIKDALKDVRPLDGCVISGRSNDMSDPLHCVPTHAPRHYSWISSIPPGSGLSAWENGCNNCGDTQTELGVIRCCACGAVIESRPHVVEDGIARSIRGFRTSYRRAKPTEISPTVTTASGRFSSDLKLHFSENRVLSPRECAILQTVPHSFVWPAEQYFKAKHLIREMIGEAVPSLVSYRLGLTIANLLDCSDGRGE